MKPSTRTIVAIGIGAAVFLGLNQFPSISSGIPNTKINTAYAFLAFMAVIFGPIAGALIGFVGHVLTDVTAYGAVWWSWVIVSVFVGAVIGLSWKKINIENGTFGKKEIIIFNLYQIAANLVGWGLLAPVLDIIFYAEPPDKVFMQGLVASLANLVTIAILGTAFLAIYARTRTKTGSLNIEK